MNEEGTNQILGNVYIKINEQLWSEVFPRTLFVLENVYEWMWKCNILI